MQAEQMIQRRSPPAPSPPTAGSAAAAPAALGASGGFVRCLYNLLASNALPHAIRWTSAGTSFVICDLVVFTSQALPLLSAHKNYASFVRQLNKYQFKKVKGSERASGPGEESFPEFKHPHFARGGEHNLGRVCRIKKETQVKGKGGKKDSDDDMEEVKHESTPSSGLGSQPSMSPMYSNHMQRLQLLQMQQQYTPSNLVPQPLQLMIGLDPASMQGFPTSQLPELHHLSQQATVARPFHSYQAGQQIQQRHQQQLPSGQSPPVDILESKLLFLSKTNEATAENLNAMYLETEAMKSELEEMKQQVITTNKNRLLGCGSSDCSAVMRLRRESAVGASSASTTSSTATTTTSTVSSVSTSSSSSLCSALLMSSFQSPSNDSLSGEIPFDSLSMMAPSAEVDFKNGEKSAFSQLSPNIDQAVVVAANVASLEGVVNSVSPDDALPPAGEGGAPSTPVHNADHEETEGRRLTEGPEDLFVNIGTRTEFNFRDVRNAPESTSILYPKRRALIVDDDAVYRKLVSAYLTRLNFNCDTASTGLEAVQKIVPHALLHPDDPQGFTRSPSIEVSNSPPPPAGATGSRATTPDLIGGSVRGGSCPPTPAASGTTARHNYHVVFMDIMLPNLNGLQATRQIREHYPDILIIALTCVNIQDEDRNTYREVGMRDILSKPIKFSTLVDCLDRNLGGVRDYLLSLPAAGHVTTGNNAISMELDP
ncbi:HSF-type DNA-binding-domain-containing protein [Obelidium mucronatum]|nr:HSF-type DNA-binding-domain-containing protein [Obelidium mucronatum]